jgi:predicted transcriptional regulator
LQKQIQYSFEEINRTQTEQQQKHQQTANLRTDLQKQVQDSFEEVNGTQREQRVVDLRTDL